MHPMSVAGTSTPGLQGGAGGCLGGRITPEKFLKEIPKTLQSTPKSSQELARHLKSALLFPRYFNRL